MTTPQVSLQTRRPTDAAQVRRPARALIGWLDEPRALSVQAAQGLDPSLPEHRERAALARAEVSHRPAGIDQSDLLNDPPAELAPHIDAWRATTSAKPFVDEGWAVRIADLPRVVGLQPTIFVDHAEERTQGQAKGDMLALGQTAIPLPGTGALPAQFDEARQSWIVTAADPNLRIVGHFSTELQPGILGLGFAVALMGSFVQVAQTGGRLVLRDGYHRTFGFLRRGITHVPVLYRDFGQYGDLGLPPGMLPPTVYLGDRPPLLPDYHDDSVSMAVSLPAFQKMLVIHGLELTPLG